MSSSLNRPSLSRSRTHSVAMCGTTTSPANSSGTSNLSISLRRRPEGSPARRSPRTREASSESMERRLDDAPPIVRSPTRATICPGSKSADVLL